VGAVNRPPTLQSVSRDQNQVGACADTHSSIHRWKIQKRICTHSSILRDENKTPMMVPFWVLDRWGYIGQLGISLSGSYQQGYSTAYNTQLHIKVVCNGYILTHVLNYNPRGLGRTFLPEKGSSPCMTRGDCLFVFM
jgi:hypothetical protein